MCDPVKTVNETIVDPFVDTVVDPIVNTVNDVVIDPVVDVVGDAYMAVRDPLEAAAVVVGNYYFPGSSILTSKLVSDGAKEQLNTPEFRIANLGAGAYGAYDGNFANYGFNSAPEAEAAYQADLNSVGGVTGPDNIDVGGGFNPAGAAAPELTAQQVTDMINAEQSSAMTAAETQAMIDAEAANAASVASATPAQVAAAKAAGMSTLDYVRAGLLVNAITGDPLKLSGGGGGGGGGGATGFDQVPIPAEWRSPTYAAPSAPIDLSSIFTDQNLLAGTQWQGLPTQQPNVSFNDIFASGQQQTPMGNMVDINQIVSSILGQNTASQKSS
jgi:hypothetical protein